MKIALFSLALLAAQPTFAHQVIGISDGDTIRILQDGRPVRIRLASIDAAESSQAYGQRSKISLSDMCYRKDASIEAVDVDQYGRTVAVVYCDGVNVNRAQVEKGMAWNYKRYSKDPALAGMEARARAAHIGLWADPDPTPPWDYRRAAR